VLEWLGEEMLRVSEGLTMAWVSQMVRRKIGGIRHWREVWWPTEGAMAGLRGHCGGVWMLMNYGLW